MPTFERIGMMPFETKSFDPATGVFVGRASTPQMDRMREVVSSEAMQEAAERYMKNPVVTDHHGGAIGRGLRVEVTPEGTVLEGYITDKTQQGRDVRGLLEDKILRSLSIGFNPYSRSYGPHEDGTPDYELVPASAKPEPTTGYGYEPWYSESTDTLVWKRIDWMETAICAIPCNPGATIALAKSMGIAMPEITGDTPEQREENRFLADVERVRTGAVSVGNIKRHWAKAGRDLSPEAISLLTEAHKQLAAALETYPVPGEADGEQTDLCLLRLPTLTLPEAPRLTLAP